jgi:hypothetical protein
MTPLETLHRFCHEHRHAVMWDPASSTLLDVYSGKPLRIDGAALSQLAERATPDGEAYAVLGFADGRQLALAPQGIAFPPDLASAGPLPGAPQVVCWRDFSSVAQQVEHVLTAHPDERPSREVLDAIRYLIAILDGARAAGFDIAVEERRVDRLVNEAERRA